ncbi:MAG: undecaprenyl-phosphate glucose phosphotransferase [Bacteriovoracaceae bacterium]
MLKNNEKLFGHFQKLSDAVCGGLCWLAAYHIRFEFFPHGQAGLETLFYKLTFLVMGLTVYFFYKMNLYRSQRFTNKLKEITTVFYANALSVLSLIVILYFFAGDRVSRLTIIVYFLLSSFVLTLLRILIRNYLRSLREKGMNLRHVLMVGNGAQCEDYVKTVLRFKDSGIKFCGWIDGDNLSQQYNINPIKAKLSDALSTLDPDAIVIGYPSKDSHKVDEIIQGHYDSLRPIQVLPDLTLSFIGHSIEDFAGIPLMTINHPKLNGLGMLFKRMVDILGGLVGLILLSPLLIIIASLVKLTSKGPIFYGQERMGLDGQPFMMWKFRSMRVTDNEDKTTWTTKDDPRKTKLGSFIRKTSIDELPQLYNVLKGNMSLVGPRPERPFFVKKFREEIPGYMLRHKMKAGITGWAQINGWRGDTSIKKRIEFDNFYIKNWSFWMDIKILFLTFWKGFINKNAY